MRALLLMALLLTSLLADRTITVATYNVENLFDLVEDGGEYPEYIPNGESQWNQRNQKIKLEHIAQVIKEIDADIIALEEVESLQALLDLRFELKKQGLYYQHYSIADKKNTTVKVALLSKLPFLYSKEISVTQHTDYRNILETKFNIDGNELYIFTNHWKSKAKDGAESKRVLSAKTLKYRVQQIGLDKNIVILGDFNSDYEEYLKFVRKRELNDTFGKTGINHVLGSGVQKERASQVKYAANSFYNLWYDTDEESRYSYIFKGKKEAMDSILISQSLLDIQGISYEPSSIARYEKEYLLNKGQIYRWKISRGKVKEHKGYGYSDHLAVVAKFRVKKR